RTSRQIVREGNSAFGCRPASSADFLQDRFRGGFARQRRAADRLREFAAERLAGEEDAVLDGASERRARSELAGQRRRVRTARPWILRPAGEFGLLDVARGLFAEQPPQRFEREVGRGFRSLCRELPRKGAADEAD